MERNQIMDGKKMVAAEEKHLIPLDKVNGYDVRPGFYGINGATALREGVNFTVCSLEATAVGACHWPGYKGSGSLLCRQDCTGRSSCISGTECVLGEAEVWAAQASARVWVEMFCRYRTGWIRRRKFQRSHHRVLASSQIFSCICWS